ncbi:MAG: hypothetical protein J0I06_19510 [Planctomycetes bacterium]|nr:hypothetical protein [Planctomycetota bacterium]
MKRFVIAAALAAVFGLGFVGKADAQYVYRHTTVTPGGGLYTTNQLYGLGGYQTQSMYVAPNGAVRRGVYYGDVFGNTAGQVYGYNPYRGIYNRGFYGNPYVYPYGGYGYNFYRRW